MRREDVNETTQTNNRTEKSETKASLLVKQQHANAENPNLFVVVPINFLGNQTQIDRPQNKQIRRKKQRMYQIHGLVFNLLESDGLVAAHFRRATSLKAIAQVRK